MFDDLIGLARVFPHPNLRIDVLAVEIDEVRLARRRWPGYGVVDRRLREVVATYPLRTSDDLWELIPAQGASPSRRSTWPSGWGGRSPWRSGSRTASGSPGRFTRSGSGGGSLFTPGRASPCERGNGRRRMGVLETFRLDGKQAYVTGRFLILV